MFEDYSQVRSWLESFIPQTWTKAELGLARIRYLLNLLGNPQNKFKSIHIAGTSGKGSTAFYIARLLELAGPVAEGIPISSVSPTMADSFVNGAHLRATRISKIQNPKSKILKIGLHISPHLVYLGERMQVSGKAIEVNKFVKLISEIKGSVESMRSSKVGSPSYFEILAAAAFMYFAHEKVDWAVVEVGLGGRLDATNVLKPEVSVITNVGLDHTEILGKTIERIAFEKAGIIKRGVPVITAADGVALKVIEKVAKTKKSPVIKINTQLGVEPLKSDIIFYKNIYKDILRNRNNFVTLDTFLLTIFAVASLGFRLTKASIFEAFNGTFSGRFEEIDEGVILDGAHNIDKIKVLIQWIKNKHLTADNLQLTSKSNVKSQRSIVLAVAFKKGKGWEKMIDLLIKNLPIGKVIATQFVAPTDTGFFEAVDADEIADYIKSKWKVKVESQKNSQEAVFQALNTAFTSEVKALHTSEVCKVLVTGSLYLVGEARTMWKLPQF